MNLIINQNSEAMPIEFSNEDVFETLKRLVELKKYKDRYGKDEHYVVEQPLLWDKAICIVERGGVEIRK